MYLLVRALAWAGQSTRLMSCSVELWVGAGQDGIAFRACKALPAWGIRRRGYRAPSV